MILPVSNRSSGSNAVCLARVPPNTPLIMQFSGNRSRITQFAFTEIACQASPLLYVFIAYNIVTRSVTCKSSSSCALPYTVLSVRITGTLRRTKSLHGPRAITICHTLSFVSMLVVSRGFEPRHRPAATGSGIN